MSASNIFLPGPAVGSSGSGQHTQGARQRPSVLPQALLLCGCWQNHRMPDSSPRPPDTRDHLRKCLCLSISCPTPPGWISCQLSSLSPVPLPGSQLSPWGTCACLTSLSAGTREGSSKGRQVPLLCPGNDPGYQSPYECRFSQAQCPGLRTPQRQDRTPRPAFPTQ